ncbi:hypothetical protein HanPSC8_Chr11g0492771 [Helianthus annuus]|nr:hypothetical protein HanPSC8_Chr11g0492771 [Helianthus annuus]
MKLRRLPLLLCYCTILTQRPIYVTLFNVNPRVRIFNRRKIRIQTRIRIEFISRIQYHIHILSSVYSVHQQIVKPIVVTIRTVKAVMIQTKS